MLKAAFAGRLPRVLVRLVNIFREGFDDVRFAGQAISVHTIDDVAGLRPCVRPGYGRVGRGASEHPGVTTSLIVCILRAVVFYTKTIIIVAVFMWTRWSLPRFRFDQIMMLAWRALIPMSLTILLVTAVVMYYFGENRNDLMRVGGKMALVMLIANGVMLIGFVIASFIIPPAPATNRKMKVFGSRFESTPLPASVASNN